MNYKEYSPDWRDIIRPAILKRDNYSCRVCGIKHKSVVYVNTTGNYTVCDDFTAEWAKNNGRKVFTIYLQVAHLDNDKSNNDPENLLTLCPTHHSKRDAEHKRMLKLTYRTKIRNSEGAPKDHYTTQRNSILKQVQHLVKALTGVKIELHEAEQIMTLTSNLNHDE